jgi:FixJ family two-component response regulator
MGMLEDMTPDDFPMIVVVEDDASMSQAIERILRAGGFTAKTFASAETALAAGAAATADCLVLDIQLPGMSGFELYQRLACGGVDFPVIFITAHDEPRIRDEAARMGAWDYLPKPFSGRTLLQAVAQAIDAV